MRNAKGVSLVEMLATLAIVCIVAGLGLPAFRSTLERQRCHAAVNLLAATLAHARNTAITRGMSISVCPLREDGMCGGTIDWSGGWITYADPSHERQPRSQPAILAITPQPVHSSVSVTSSTGRLLVRFLKDGRSGGSNIRFRVCSDGRIQGEVIVNNLGRIRTLKTPGIQACP